MQRSPAADDGRGTVVGSERSETAPPCPSQAARNWLVHRLSAPVSRPNACLASLHDLRAMGRLPSRRTAYRLQTGAQDEEHWRRAGMWQVSPGGRGVSKVRSGRGIVGAEEVPSFME
jgi:hypothetical protein